ncbi:MAG: V-type ATP synthase subunit I [Firmicutes bacterium]|nr:V-type ATP synthase subunit I [Bacillota bacterium]
MGIAKTNLINITAHIDYLETALVKFINLECFHPVESSLIVGKVHGLTTFNGDNPCNISLGEISEIEREFDFKIKEEEVKEIEYSVDNVCGIVTSIHLSLNKMVEKSRAIQEKIQKYQDALVQIHNIESLDISFDDIFLCEYIAVRVGKIPTDSIDKLRFYRSRPFVFKSFSEDGHYSWCMYFTANRFKREVDNIFSSLFFSRVHIPDFVHGTPLDAEVVLQNEIEKANEELKILQGEVRKLLESSSDSLSYAKGSLKLISKMNEAKKYVVGIGDKFTITGFVEESNAKKIVKAYDDVEEIGVEVFPSDYDKRLTPPTLLKNRWFSRPFSMFVEMYGLPRTGDIDPTPFVAITYCLLFGIMFGDVGQGLLLSLLGFLLAKFKGLRIGEIGIRIGLFSAFFGLIYGSVFGNEEILNPLYTNILGFSSKPVHVMDSTFTMTLLIAAVAIGGSLIVLSMLLNMITNFRQKNYAEVLLSHNGLAGLLFYLFIGVGFAVQSAFDVVVFNSLTISLLAVIPLTLIFIKEPIHKLLEKEKMFPEGIGGFFTEGIFELFEVLLSYVTNTMSFMRVGGFVLSHAGMMLVVYSLMSMQSGAVGSTIVFIIGNLFVMGLEGMIVGIQVLRLEFFEMFSRYYKGDGLAFETFR